MIGRRTANLGLPEAAGLAKPAAMTSPQEGRPAAPDSCGPAAAQAPEDRTIKIQAGPHIITAADPSPTTSAEPSTASTGIQVRTKLA